jgi:hypothetical protein
MKDNIKESYRNNSKPMLAELLAILKLDKNYIRAEGDFLYYLDNDAEKRVLDLTGGYGLMTLSHRGVEKIMCVHF